jgi:histidinol-phosphatase (PHP family)
VLTDYHVHLRPDEPGTPPSEYFTDENARRFLDAAEAAGVSELGISEHIHRFRQSLDVWRHPFWVEQAVDDLDAYVEFLAASPLKVGFEADWIKGAGDRIADLLSRYRFDYVVGSVHFVGESSMDQDRWDVWELERGDPDKVWAKYFEHLADAARSGLYDILAHPDLVKVWGLSRPTPEGDLRRFYEPAVEAIAESGIAVEISTAGLRKPVGEIYPAPLFAELCVEAGACFALSSDAHLPEHVGFGYDEAVEFARGLGITELAVFEGRERRLEPIG